MTLEEAKAKRLAILGKVCLEISPGWTTLVDKLCDALSPECRATQVKEKFGGLRFYVDSATDQDYAAIYMAEWLSSCICEECGTNRDVTTAGSYVRTLCTKCRGEKA